MEGHVRTGHRLQQSTEEERRAHGKEKNPKSEVHRKTNQTNHHEGQMMFYSQQLLSPLPPVAAAFPSTCRRGGREGARGS